MSTQRAFQLALQRQEAVIAQAAAERAAREEEEANKWMSLISVDKEGTGKTKKIALGARDGCA
jgi:hypothetical protein